jgi:hypothetical protein
MENNPPRQFREDSVFGDKWKQLEKFYESLNSHLKKNDTT